MRAGGPGALAGARVGQHVSAVDGRLLGDTDEEQAGEARLASALPGERVSLEVLFAAAATARWQCDVLLEHSVQSTPCDRAACRMQPLHSNVQRATCRMQHLHSNVRSCGVQNATLTFQHATCDVLHSLRTLHLALLLAS